MTQPKLRSASHAAPNYIDVFAGCGGLSLGLERAGWRGLFAIEKDRFAFDTLKANFLLPNGRFNFAWPEWLDQRPWTVEDLISTCREQLEAMKGTVDLLAGGPPCQGFSSAGRRLADDPRNAMFERYLELVDILQPRILFVENVRGFTQDFKGGARSGKSPRENSAAQLARRLSHDYHVTSRLLVTSDFGVPQSRPRFILVGVRKGTDLPTNPLARLERARLAVLQRYDIPCETSAADAISDLEVGRNRVVQCQESPGFEALDYVKPLTAFQRAMRDGHDGPPTDTRLARHTALVRERFANIIEMCRSSERSTRSLSTPMRVELGLRKMATRVLDPGKPSPTVTSMPDDLLHYSEPRTLSVRENARLQTFPDWFVFKGKYTTGGHLRRQEVPRFTQVANAVPPLFAEIVGQCLLSQLSPELPIMTTSASSPREAAVEACPTASSTPSIFATKSCSPAAVAISLSKVSKARRLSE